MKDNLLKLPRRSVRQGAPGAGWLIAGIYIFSVFVFTAWIGGWGANHARTAAPPAQHHSITNGSGSAH